MRTLKLARSYARYVVSALATAAFAMTVRSVRKAIGAVRFAERDAPN